VVAYAIVFAILGLRALYFALEEPVDSFDYPARILVSFHVSMMSYGSMALRDAVGPRGEPQSGCGRR
jgi:predicted tellurium resistance membrane protein TerC